MKFSIRAKILSAFGVALGATAFFVVAVVGNSQDDGRHLDELNRIDEGRTLTQDLELQIANIWQFLTDASLTRDQDVVSGPAQKAYDRARSDVAALASAPIVDDQDQILAALSQKLEAFWSQGTGMVGAYGRSWEEGNEHMEVFDGAGEALLEGFHAFREPLESRRANLVADFEANFATDLQVFLAAGVGTAVLLIVLALVLARMIGVPVRTAGRTLRVLAESQGDLTVRLPVTGRDETTDLAQSVNAFLEKLRGILVAVEDLVYKNQNLSTSLNESARESTSSVSDLGQRVSALRQGLGSLDESIAGASAAIEQILANIASLAQQIRNQDQMMSRSGTAVQQIMTSITSVSDMAEEKVRSVSVLVDLTRQGGERVRKTNAVIGKVAENSAAMLSLIDVINDISDRTNLLAMNASIEAAHAGSAGRGFAVVAEEIRKLAEGTSANAHKIAESLKSTGDYIRQAREDGQATQEAFGLLETEVGQFAQAMHEVTSAMGSFSEGGMEILTAMAELIQTSQVISTSSQEMDQGAQEILRAVHHVKTVSADSLQEVTRVDGLTGDLNRVALRVSAFGNQNRYNNTVLRSEIERFQLGTDDTVRSDTVQLGIDWNDLLSVGIHRMDDEHKELFRRINALLVSLLGPEGGARTPELVAAIREYAVYHFDDEQELMKSQGYPKYEQHKRLHDTFLAEFVAIETVLVETGINAEILVRLQDKVVNWLLDHIAKVDHDYGEYLAGRGL